MIPRTARRSQPAPEPAHSSRTSREADAQVAPAITTGRRTGVRSRELPETMQDRIRALAHANPRVLGMHDLRTRQSGRLSIIRLHLDLDGSMTLQQAHDIAEEVEAAIHQAFAGVDVVIHQDPVTR